MKGAGRGSIVNVSSAAIDAPYAGIGVYAFTKAAVAMLTMTAALEAGEYGIRINVIAPGLVVTPFTTWRLHKPDGTIDQQFSDGMVGCAGSTTFSTRAALCAPGYRMATAQEWLNSRGAVVPTHNERSGAPIGEDTCENALHPFLGYSHQLGLRPGRIGHRPEEVEHGQDAHLLAWLHRLGHGGMEGRREHEPDPALSQATGHLVRRERDLHPERLEEVRRAAPG